LSTRTVLTVVGGIVGAYFGYPQLGLVVGSLVGGAVDPQQIQGPKIGEVAAQTSAEGAPRTIIYGTIACYGNVIQTGQLIKVEESESQGKGGPEVTTERGYRTYAIRISEGPIDGVLRIWADNKLVYDMRTDSGMVLESEDWISNKAIYLGGEDQLPDPVLVSTVNPDTPAYRGSAYIVFVLEDLTDRQGSIPQYRFEVTTNSTFIPIENVDSFPQFVSGFYSNETDVPLPPQDLEVTMTDLVEDARVCLFEFEVLNVEPGAGVTTTFTLQYDGTRIYTSSIEGNGTVLVQLSTLGEQFILATHITGSLIPTAIAYSASIIYPTPGEIDPTYVAYAAEDPVYPDNPLYGVLEIPDVGLIGASWGPEFITTVGGPIFLSSIVSDIHSRCGGISSTLDTSELTDLVSGLALAGDYTGASAIDTLRTIYFFDKSLHDGKFWYPKRGAAVIETLTIDDLTEVPDTTKREQALEIPNKINLRYQHARSGYAPVKATAPRTQSPDFLTTGEASIEVPVVLDENQAVQTVDKMYKVVRFEVAGTTEITVPLNVGARYADGNCIGLSLRGRLTRQRIEQMAFDGWKLKLTLKPDRQSAYTSDLTGVPIPEPTLPPSTIVGATELAILDISARVDSEDQLGYLVAVDGALPPWYGARYQRSFDSGATYSTVEDIRTASVMGVLVGDVPQASEFFTDTTNEVVVDLYRASHSIQSITEQQFLSEQGAFALEKDDGSWEVMQYLDAYQDSSGFYVLSTLHRGLLNSGSSEHTTGARFVMLDRPSYEAAQASWIGSDITHRAISLGSTSDDTENEETQTFVGRSQIEWPVAYLELYRDISDTISGSWTPRHRFGSDDYPVASINFQGYRVTIDDGIAPAITLDTSTPGFTYDASGLSSPVTVSVSSVNRITGAGPATSESI
jgi:hypothetical protein